MKRRALADRAATSLPTRRVVVFLPDAGPAVGLGHIGRCMALAEAFASLGWIACFELGDPAARAAIRRRGFRTACGGRAHIAIVDSYLRPSDLIRDARRRAAMVAAVDDLHRVRAADVDRLIRPSLGERPSAHVLGGTPFVLLRKEYWRRLPRRAIGNGPVRRVTLTLGAYPDPASMRTAVDVIREVLPAADLNVIIGLSGVRLKRARGLVPHRLRTSLRPLLLGSDIVVTAGGQTLYECLASAAPTIVIGTAENQRPQLRAAIRTGAVLDAGWTDHPRWAVTLERRVRALARSSSLRRRLASAAGRIVDGRGAKRVADALVDQWERCGVERMDSDGGRCA